MARIARFWSRRGSDGGRRGLVSYSREDLARLNARFMSLERGQRRAIMRAVNRGQVVADRRHADLAIGVARRQQRFWRSAWLLGPTIALAQAALTPIGLQEGLLLAAWGTMILGSMAWWWYSRAARAELLNAELVRRRPGGGRRGGRRGDDQGGRGAGDAMRPSPRRARLPGGPTSAPRPADRADEHDEHDEDDWDDMDDPSGEDGAGPSGPTAPKPPRPRGRKRR
jgi:hypothetical protein